MNDGIYTISQYIESKSDLLAKITAIKELIAAMELKMLDVTGSAEYDEYQLDDGQMKIRTKYRSVKDVSDGILGLEKIKQRYVNRYNGRTSVFRSGNICR